MESGPDFCRDEFRGALAGQPVLSAHCFLWMAKSPFLRPSHAMGGDHGCGGLLPTPIAPPGKPIPVATRGRHACGA